MVGSNLIGASGITVVILDSLSVLVVDKEPVQLLSLVIITFSMLLLPFYKASVK